MSEPLLPANDLPFDPFDDFLVKQAGIFEKGDQAVPSEAVEEYLNETERYISDIFEIAEKTGMDPALVEILGNFLRLTDERNKDGSVERRMMSYHTRVCNRLNEAYRRDNLRADDASSIVNMMVALNFNKPSVVEYYQRKVPLWVALKEMPNPHTNVSAADADVAFNPLYETMENLVQATFPFRGKAYDEEAPSLKDYIKASVEVSLDSTE